MAKLVQCLRGKIFDAIVDARPKSPTYLRWDGFILDDENHHQLYVPAGFAHGFLTLSDEAIVAYKQTAHFDPASEFRLRWDDPRVGIAWPLLGAPIVSAKDAA
jgi:dTDP-4-dehydrorhamnose 3,5-epimerase